MTRPRRPPDDRAAQLAAIVESSNDAIIGKTLDGVIMSWNPAAEKMFGYRVAEAIGQPITIIIPAERLDEEAQVLSRIRRGETVEHFETVRMAKGGQRVSVSLTVSPIKDASGGVIGASKIARDMTERLQADASRSRLAAVVEWSEDAIIGKTLDGVITSWNPAAEKMFGYAAAEAIGRPITLLIPEERRREGDEVLARIRRGDRVEPFETVRVAKSGRRLTVSLTVSPIRTAAGRIVGGVEDRSRYHGAPPERNAGAGDPRGGLRRHSGCRSGWEHHVPQSPDRGNVRILTGGAAGGVGRGVVARAPAIQTRRASGDLFPGSARAANGSWPGPPSPPARRA